MVNSSDEFQKWLHSDVRGWRFNVYDVLGSYTHTHSLLTGVRVRKKGTDSYLALTSINLDNFTQFLAQIIMILTIRYLEVYQL